MIADILDKEQKKESDGGGGKPLTVS